MDGFIFCAGVIAFFVVLFGFIVLMRYMNFRETMALAEKGLAQPERPRRNGKDTLRWGIIIAALGLALCLGLWPLGVNSDFPLGFGPWMLAGLAPLFFGLALILIHVLTHEEKTEKTAPAPINKPPVASIPEPEEPEPPAQTV